MKYGERLAAARLYNNGKGKKLSQGELAEKAGTTQANISALEMGRANGSEFTAQFANACGVNPMWLATGKGEMADIRYHIVDDDLRSSLAALEDLKPYLKKIAVTEIVEIIQNVVEVSRKKTSQ